ncbi:cytochrome c [Roseibacterium sp. SDUM158016]|jgi:mono/diheme cytochrome c family protein|uniref:cytochrome c n=1 Tax=Roseicyclus sediminis TaxID=2980997 RepID=UPI0021D15F32|nr:cytochrome c [Roseibacterium sp. SDUM158016]MCU4652689.1 cytochrome c [Roseibacterium sp. SDUM158016]
MGLKLMRLAATAALLGSGAAHAQSTENASAILEAGQVLYEANCAMCHQASGAGRPPTFPDLRGNDLLADPYLVVSKISQGLGNMPPFPTLSAEEITAITNYIGTAWGNSFGGPGQGEVEEILAEFDPPMDVRTIWDGVYTQEQAQHGQDVYRAPCGLCHGRRLNGAPDDSDMVPAPVLARQNFLRNWDGRSLGMLFTYTMSTMPQSNPGFMPPEDYAAIIAHMLSVTGAPPGEEELSADAWELGHIVISPEP